VPRPRGRGTGPPPAGRPPGRVPGAPPGIYGRAVHEPADDADAGPDVEIVDGSTTWRFETSFLRSNWTCIWGRGCLGIEARPDAAGGLGCCSVGAELEGVDEPRLISALAATLDPARFEHADAAAAGGVFADERRNATRVVDGACVFLNRPGFAGGAGCALHLAALDAGEAPSEWKPAVCAELPVKVDWADGADGTETATVRRWSRADWGPEGATMAWCCTEGDLAYVGDRPVVESLAGELRAIVGTEVYVELRRRLTEPPPAGPGSGSGSGTGTASGTGTGTGIGPQ
jgi:hypothetical protein